MNIKSSSAMNEVNATTIEKSVATLANGEKLSLRRVGKLWAVMSDKDGVVQKADSMEDAVRVIGRALRLERKRSEWMETSIDKSFEIRPKILVKMSKEPGHPLQVAVYENGFRVAKFDGIVVAIRMNGIMLSESVSLGNLEFNNPVYGEIAVSQAEKLLGVKATPRCDKSVESQPSVERFWQRRVRDGKSPAADPSERHVLIGDMAALLKMAAFFHPEATAVLGQRLAWPMKAAMDPDGAIEECWLEAPDGSQFDGVEFLAAGTIERDLPSGCVVVDQDVSKIVETDRNGRAAAAVMRLLKTDIESHSAPAFSMAM
jgi:hypothetical protein